MARRNFGGGGGVLTRQLVGGNRNKHQLRARLLSNSIQTLNSSRPSKPSPPQPPQTAINWKLAAATSSVYYRYSLLHYHPNPNLHFVRHKHSVPLPDGDRDPAPCPPPNVFFLNVAPEYDDALKQVEDESLSAVFYFTERRGPSSVSYSSDDPILNYMCVFYPHITKFGVCFFKNGGCCSLYRLGVYKTPTFHFFLKGEKVDELAKPSINSLLKTLANVYNPSGMKKKERQAKKVEVDPSQLVEVLPISFVASSYPKAMEAVESLPGVEPGDTLWWSAKGLFLSQEKRETFSKLEDDDAKLEWLCGEMAEGEEGEMFSDEWLHAKMV
ncbi:uncharacterized protein LOC126619437 isoform X3 [Malus sylvestris]|uniref:uncharacterized protein LOC126619437 isoform X3 n=1 Tax=Malus sylvestris TaxID=3752 RepID=UPI0021ACBF85|nr:uncharacterized protein LOC126619437 isoform X3 [Malus sylvestris]